MSCSVSPVATKSQSMPTSLQLTVFAILSPLTGFLLLVRPTGPVLTGDSNLRCPSDANMKRQVTNLRALSLGFFLEVWVTEFAWDLRRKARGSAPFTIE